MALQWKQGFWSVPIYPGGEYIGDMSNFRRPLAKSSYLRVVLRKWKICDDGQHTDRLVVLRDIPKATSMKNFPRKYACSKIEILA